MLRILCFLLLLRVGLNLNEKNRESFSEKKNLSSDMDISDSEDNPSRTDTTNLKTSKDRTKRQNLDINRKTGQCEIFLTEADFDIMKPVLHQHTYGRFTEPGWFRLINDKIIANKTLTNISLNLQRHRFLPLSSKVNTRPGSPFLRITAYCVFYSKFKCNTDYLITLKCPPQNFPIGLLVEKFGHCNHPEGAVAARNQSGFTRVNIKSALNRFTPLGLRHRNSVMYSGSNETYDLTHHPDLSILHKIRHEMRRDKLFHANYKVDLERRMQYYKEEYRKENPPKHIQGAIQNIEYPLRVQIFSENMLSALPKNKDVVLYFDSTGGCTSVFYDQSQGVYLYAIVMANPKGGVPIPLAYMVSELHGTVKIKPFLENFRDGCSKVLNKKFRPLRIVIDYSWALMYSTIEAFNYLDFPMYMEKCRKIIDKKAGPYDLESFTHIYFCNAHIMKALCNHLKKYKPAVKNFAKSAMQNMIEESDFQRLNLIFYNFCVICLSPYRNSHVDKAVGYFEKINQANGDDNCGLKKDVSFNEAKEFDKVKKSSPFYKFFEGTLNSARNVAALGGEPNEFYCPKLPEHFLNNYMFAAPMWTGIMFDLNRYRESYPRIAKDKCTDANAYVENFFGQMKRTFKWENMSDRLNVCVFISCLISFATSIIAEIKVPRKPKKKR